MEEKYNWNLKDLFKDEAEYQKTKEELQSQLIKIEEMQGSITNSMENLYLCYHSYEETLKLFEKLYSYGMFIYHLDMANQEGIKKFKEVENLATEFTTKTSYIVPEITYADEETIKTYLKADCMKEYTREILDILEKKKHTLSKAEENLLANYVEIFSSAENTFDILTNAEFKFGTFLNEEGKETELTESNYSIYLKSSDRRVRKEVFELLYKKYQEHINTITELYITNVKTNAITAKLRNYTSCLEKAVIHDDASIKVYNSLIEAINENIESNYEFLEIKKELLELEDLHIYDIYVNPCQIEKDEITFEEAKKEVIEALSILGEEYKKLLETAFKEQWIDAFAKTNKRGGAYSSGVYGVHPFVLTNFLNSKRDVSTIAHELGHSIHSYYSNKNQNIMNANYTIMVAEVASTVNEILLSDYQLKHESNPKKKAEILYELLEMIRATFFRQAMFAEFEKIVHEKVETGEMLASKDLNEIYYSLNQKYFGPAINIDKDIQYEWARIPHFYSDFYVYKYATGISAAIAIATKILNQEEGFTKKYLEMLKQGCSKKSIELLKMVDVDLENPETYQNTTNFYRQKMKELKELLKNK